MALQRGDQSNFDIWLFDLARNTSSRLTFDPAEDLLPVWSPEGDQIVFASSRDGKRNLYKKASNGVGNEELLLKSDEDKIAIDWSHDGSGSGT